ncbi:hypothetical protein THOB06_240005 [Vibrio rotiferianus]|nr:hypothetical protein THOB06_240005 [Vibrio rotiferianus]
MRKKFCVVWQNIARLKRRVTFKHVTYDTLLHCLAYLVRDGHIWNSGFGFQSKKVRFLFWRQVTICRNSKETLLKIGKALSHLRCSWRKYNEYALSNDLLISEYCLKGHVEFYASEIFSTNEKNQNANFHFGNNVLLI